MTRSQDASIGGCQQSDLQYHDDGGDRPSGYSSPHEKTQLQRLPTAAARSTRSSISSSDIQSSLSSVGMLPATRRAIPVSALRRKESTPKISHGSTDSVDPWVSNRFPGLPVGWSGRCPPRMTIVDLMKFLASFILLIHSHAFAMYKRWDIPNRDDALPQTYKSHHISDQHTPLVLSRYHPKPQPYIRTPTLQRQSQ